jgi:hypothetical protein
MLAVGAAPIPPAAGKAPAIASPALPNQFPSSADVPLANCPQWAELAPRKALSAAALTLQPAGPNPASLDRLVPIGVG